MHVRAKALHSRRFSQAGRTPRHRLPREGRRTDLLLRSRQPNRRASAGGVQGWKRRHPDRLHRPQNRQKAGFCGAHGRGDVLRTVALRGDQRPVLPADGRFGPRLRDRGAVRPRGRLLPPRAGAAHLPAGGPQTHRRTLRNLRRRDRRQRRHGLHGRAPLHPPGAERPRHPAALELLERRAADRHRPAAGPAPGGGDPQVALRAPQGRAQDPAARAPARAAQPLFRAAAWRRPPRAPVGRTRGFSPRPQLSRLADPAPAGTAGWARAEVTRGGVDTRELSSKTFESRKVPGLFFVGEVLDAAGWLGGYNFQWAWFSGHCAGVHG